MLEHLELMVMALLAAVTVGLPVGVIAARIPLLSAPLLLSANIVQTIPSVALLGFLLPVLGIGKGTAIVALFLYALLPIVSNTIAGLRSVDADVRDAARGMGMSQRQILLGVEFPLARPVIFAGIRTAAVINVGVTTLSALVGAGGLGIFIFRGLATNNTAIILLGAVPAALLALFADNLLAFFEWMMRRHRLGVSVVLAVLLAGGFLFLRCWHPGNSRESGALRFGFTAEFMERADGFEAWRNHYNFPRLDSRELDPGLLYQALKNEEVDAACGFSTDGRIEAFRLRALRDDRRFFPSYDAALLVREEILEKHPELRPLLEELRNAIDEKQMRLLNKAVDLDKKSPAQVAGEFLAGWTSARKMAWSGEGARAKAASRRPADITIGTKNFTEQYVLGEIIRQLINGGTRLQAGIKPGLGGTSICFLALERGEIDLYPEYSGTLFASVLKPPQDILEEVTQNPVAAENHLREKLSGQYQMAWMAPFGFGNTYAILVPESDPRFSKTETISDLKKLLDF